MPSKTVTTWEYKNDFFAIKVNALKHRTGAYNYSIGLNLSRFNPIIWGRTGICSNAAFKGLQQMRADVSYFALQRGIVTRDGGIPVAVESGSGDGWYQESSLVIENASPEEMREILEFGARDLVQTILTACQRD